MEKYYIFYQIYLFFLKVGLVFKYLAHQAHISIAVIWPIYVCVYQ